MKKNFLIKTYILTSLIYCIMPYAGAQEISEFKWKNNKDYFINELITREGETLSLARPEPFMYFKMNDIPVVPGDLKRYMAQDSLIRFRIKNKVEIRIRPAHNFWQSEIVFRNIDKDTLSLSNVIPFGRNEDHVYITARGDEWLSKSKLFRPGCGPVGVILPDNAWELGYHDVPLANGRSLASLTRRISWQKAVRKRFETLLAPGGEVTYHLFAELYSGPWQEGLRKIFQEKKLYDLPFFDNQLFERKDLEWIRHSYIIHLLMAWDHHYYDRQTGKFTIYDFIKRGKKWYGGDDVIGLWPTWPTLGLDQRNQYDLYADLPGGLETIKTISDSLKKSGVKLFISYNPWDEGTRYEDHLNGLEQLLSTTHADGVVLDTRGSSSFELQETADRVKPGIVLYSEGMAVPKDMAGIVAGRVHNALYYPPLLNLNKLIKPDFAIFRVAELAYEPIRREYATAFFNGYGTEINLFKPGQPEWIEEDYRFLGKTTRILRENHRNFTGSEWTPLLPALNDSIYINKWPGENKEVYTIFSLVPEGFKGRLFEVESKEGFHFVDLWNHEEGKVVAWEEKKFISAELESFPRHWLGSNREGAVGCIAHLREWLKVKIRFDTLHIESKAGSELRIWKGIPTYENEPIFLPAGTHQLRIPEHFGRFEGKLVIQLFDGHLLDERIVYLEPGLARKATVSRSTKKYNNPPDGMIRVPGGIFVQRYENGGDFISYPEVEGNEKIEMPEFFIDRTPVTNLQFSRFLLETGYRPGDTVNFLRHWNNGLVPQGLEHYPVVYVSLEDAEAYAEWAGKRLPSEMEWQYAAQTEKGNVWPWGNEYDSTRCNPGNGVPDPVGKYPEGANPLGIIDLVGPVWQMTADIYDSGSYSFSILKGGSYFKPAGSEWYVQGGPFPLSRRQMLLRVSPGFERNATVGFRCVADK